jgi:hypothetical protein
VGFVPKRLIGAGAVLTTVGLVLGTQGSTVLGLTGVALVLAGLYLMAFGVWSFKRGVLGALIAATVLAGIFLLTTPAMRRILFGTESGRPGLGSRHPGPLAARPLVGTRGGLGDSHRRPRAGGIPQQTLHPQPAEEARTEV